MQRVIPYQQKQTKTNKNKQKQIKTNKKQTKNKQKTNKKVFYERTAFEYPTV